MPIKSNHKKKRAILFTGYNHKLDNIVAAQKAGFCVLLITKKLKPEAEKIFDDIFEVNFEKKEALDEVFPLIREKYIVKAVVSNYEHYVVQRSYIAEKLGAACTSVYGACCTRNKLLQRHALSVMEENIPWGQASTLKEAEEVFEKLGKKTIFLKAISGIKSRCIYKIKTLKELREAWKHFQEVKFKLDEDLCADFRYLDFRFIYPNPQEAVLLEQSVEGQEITVESLVGSHRIYHTPSLCDVYPARSIGRQDSFLAFRILPSRQSEKVQKEAKIVAETAIRILGLQYCSAHSQLILTPQGDMKIIEVASRMGGYRASMYREAYDLSLPDILIQVITGKKVSPPEERKNYVSMLEFFPSERGTFESIKDMQKIREDARVREFTVKVEKGDKVGKACDGYPPVATMMLAANTYQEVYDASLHYQRELEVKIK